MPYDLQPKDLIIFGAGVLVTIALGYFFYLKSLGRRHISYSVQTKNLIFRSRDYPSDLKISFGDRDVESLTRFTVYVWNSGNQAIKRNELETKKPLSLVMSQDIQLLQKSVTFQTRDANNVSLSDNLVSFDYLNPRDGFILDIFVDRKSAKEDSLDQSIKIDGEIVDVARSPQAQDFDFCSGTFKWLVLAILSGLGLWLLGSSVYRNAPIFWNSPTISGTAVIVIGVPFVLFICLIFIIGMLGTFGSEKIPLTLILKGEQRKGFLSRLAILFR